MKAERLSCQVQLLQASTLAASGQRRFRMVANTGTEFARRYGRTVANLSGMSIPKKLPILLNHDDDDVVGYADRHELTAEGLVLEGVLLTDEPAGKRVAALSDSGFPLTASVGVNVDRVEEVEAGKKARLNGRDFDGPITVWAKSSLFETSVVTANPADKNTSAQVLTGQNAEAEDAAAMLTDVLTVTLKAGREVAASIVEDGRKLQALSDLGGTVSPATARALARGQVKASQLATLQATLDRCGKTGREASL